MKIIRKIVTSGSLWNHYRVEINDDVNETDDKDNKINNNKTTASKSFKYKTKLIGSTPNNNNDNNSRLNAKAVVSLKYLSNFWRSLKLPTVKQNLT